MEATKPQDSSIGYVTLRSIVAEYLMGRGYANTDVHQFKHELWAVQAARNLYNNAIRRKMRTVEVEINGVFRAPLPCDYLNWVAVGTNTGDRIIEFNYDPRLLVWNKMGDCGDKLANEYQYQMANRYGDWGYDAYRFWNRGLYVGGSFGHQGGNYLPSFNIDEKSREIVFQSTVRGQVLMQYEQSVKGFNALDEVPEEEAVQQAIRAYIRWQYEDNKSRPDRSQVIEHKSEFFRLKRVIRRQKLLNNMNLGQFVNAADRSNTATPT